MRANPLRNINIRRVNTKFLVVFGFVFVLIGGLPSGARAAGASLYLSPASGSFFVGSTFDVSVFVDSGGESLNAVKVDMTFDPSKIQVASPTAGKSFIKVWVSQPTYSNTKGTISFIGGIPSPGINTTAGLVSTVTFRAVAPGKATISFADSSKILRNDPEGTNILTSTGRGVYNLLIPPPEGPNVFSPTHPDKSKWYKNNNPTFSWDKEEGTTGFSYSFDQDPTGVPDNKSEGSHTSVSYSGVKDGIWYFHIKAEKGNVWGGVSHYSVQIDATPPAVFTPKVRPFARTDERQPLVYFITTDALSGLDYYQIKYIDITSEERKETAGFFVEASSPYRLPSLAPGKYLVIVRAVDAAGNYREGTVKIHILPKGIIVSKKGIQWKGIGIPWWSAIMFLIIVLLLAGFYLYKEKRRQRARLLGKRDRFLKAKKKLGEHRKKILDGIKRNAN